MGPVQTNAANSLQARTIEVNRVSTGPVQTNAGNSLQGFASRRDDYSIEIILATGKPSRQKLGTTIRPIQRDGGARVFVPGRLYGQVRDAHQKALTDQWSRFWE